MNKRCLILPPRARIVTLYLLMCMLSDITHMCFLLDARCGQLNVDFRLTEFHVLHILLTFDKKMYLLGIGNIVSVYPRKYLVPFSAFLYTHLHIFNKKKKKP